MSADHFYLNLRLKITAFSKHFPLNMLFILKKLAFEVEMNGKTLAADLATKKR